MNNIRQIQALNRRELVDGVSPEASWHTDYRDTAYIYIGGLPYELSEGDVITIFSQFGEPTFVNLIRDKDTGKSKGFAFLKYEDQRSTDLAVDNLGGAVIMGRTLRVDHTRYKKKDGEPEESGNGNQSILRQSSVDDKAERDNANIHKGLSTEAQLSKEERELEAIMRDFDDDDPMKSFLIEEKKEEIALKLGQQEDRDREGRDHKRHNRHHHRHSHHREGSHRHTSRRRPRESGTSPQ